MEPTSPKLNPPTWEPFPAIAWAESDKWDPEKWSLQSDAIEAIAEALDRSPVVLFDAPTGSGKTLVADAVARFMARRAVYTCTSKQLQHQVEGDFPYARVLKGKVNYPTERHPFPLVTADDCMGKECDFCPRGCPYKGARAAASGANLAVLNTAYFINSVQSDRSPFAKPTLLHIFDEADTLEGELLSQVEYSLSYNRLRSLKVTAPRKGSHMVPTIVNWLENEVLAAISRSFPRADTSDIATNRRVRGLRRLESRTKKAIDSLRRGDTWIRDNDAGPFVLKPVHVSCFGKEMIWDHGSRFLLMSATIVGPDQMAADLGIEDYELVKMPMTFPIENRPIFVAPAANMTKKLKDSEWPKMAKAVNKVLKLHPDERVLIHTVSYDLSRYLGDHLERPTISYAKASEREAALEEFKATEGGVLLASSMERGVDLPDDLCRVVIVAKVPYPNLGDTRTSARLFEGVAGQIWYACETIRSLVQMTGRGVRHSKDHAVCYILDEQFISNVYKKNKRLFPAWWAEAVRYDRIIK